MPKIAHTAADDGETELGHGALTKIARLTTEQGADGARESIQRTGTSVADAAQRRRQTVQQSAGEAAELGRVIVDLLSQQTRHNMQVAAAFGRTFDWAEVAEIQRDYINGTFGRMTQLGERYRSLMQAGMKSMSFPSRQ